MPFKSKEVYITINISVAIISIQRACLMTTSVILLAVLLMSINMKNLPLIGPVLPGCPKLGMLEERYKVIGYADDIKPAITSMR